MELLKRQRILLVDDDPSIRLSLSYFFRKKSKFFMGLKNAELALDHLRTEAYDIVLCDYRLPGMDGLAFFQELQRLDLPVLKVLITAYGSLELAIEAIKIGVHDFILKPFNAVTVEESLTRLVENHGQPTLIKEGHSVSVAKIRQEEQKKQKHALRILRHRMNNVLQTMLGNADLCLMDLEQNHPAKKGLDGLIDGIEKMMELIEEIKYSSTSHDSENEMRNVFQLSTVEKNIW